MERMPAGKVPVLSIEVHQNIWEVHLDLVPNLGYEGFFMKPEFLLFSFFFRCKFCNDNVLHFLNKFLWFLFEFLFSCLKQEFLVFCLLLFWCKFFNWQCIVFLNKSYKTLELLTFGTIIEKKVKVLSLERVIPVTFFLLRELLSLFGSTRMRLTPS